MICRYVGNKYMHFITANSERERGDENLLSVARVSAGHKILVRGT
jgi:hypothetical protein